MARLLTVTWVAPASDATITHYTVNYTPMGGTAMSKVVDAAETTTTLTGLTNGTEYTITVTATSSGGTSAASDAVKATPSATGGTTDPTDPTDPTGKLAPPTGFTVTKGTDAGEVDATWTAVTGATGYSIQSRPSNSNAWTAHTVPGGTTEKTTITGLVVTSMYYFRIATVNSAGTGTYTTEDVSTSPSAATEMPAPPRDVKLKAKGRDSIEVTWKPGIIEGVPNKDDADRIRYEVGWTDTAATTAFVPMSTPVSVGRSETKYMITGLKVDQTYRVAVRSVSGNTAGTVVTRGDWMPSPPASEMTPAAPGGTHGGTHGVTVTAGDGMVTVSWDRNGNAAAYIVQWRGRNQGYDDLADPAPKRNKTVTQPASGTTVTTTIEGLTNGTEVHVRVTAWNERGAGNGTAPPEASFGPSSSEARATPMAGKLAAPNPVEVMPGDGQVTVMWTGVTGAAKYRIQWRTAAQSYNSTRQAEGFYQRSSGALEHEHTVDGLENGTQYMFRVYAVDADGMMSDPSDEVSTTPMVPTPALPVFGALVLGAGLVAAGRRRLRARRLLNA